MNDTKASTAALLESSIDRFQEAHFFLHGMEVYYHFSDPFRWHLNAFLRALKEVPQLLQMELQNRSGFTEWFRLKTAALKEDPLLSYLSRQRDFVVHRGMLRPRSTAMLGITEGRGIKLGIGKSLDPLSDSDTEMTHFVAVLRERGDFFGLLEEDEESLPCIQREWRLEQFQEENLVDLASRAWLRIGETVREVAEWAGLTMPALDLSCRHDLNTIRIRVYRREDLREGRIEGFHVAQSDVYPV